MKILQLNSGTEINGAVTYCKFLTERLVKFGHPTTVVCRPGSWLADQLPENIPLVINEMNRRPAELQKFAKWIREQKFDVIHTHMSRAHGYGVLLKYLTGVPVVATAHNCSFQLHWRMNDYVLANSHATMDYHLKINRLPRQRIETIHCFTDLQRFLDVPESRVKHVRGELRLKGHEFVVGVVGDVCERKGQVVLFQALKQIAQAVPNLKVVMIGRFHRQEPYVKKLRSIQLRDKIFCRVKWLGYRYNIEDFMHAFDLCVVPSIREPLGLVALEAFAGKTPVIAANVGGLPEIVKHNENGLLFKSKDSNELAAGVIRLAKDQPLREQFGAAGRQTVTDRFNPETLTRQVEQALERVVAKKTSQASRKVA